MVARIRERGEASLGALLRIEGLGFWVEGLGVEGLGG